MRRISLFSSCAAALILTGFGGWIASTTQAHVAPLDVAVSAPSTLELTLRAGDLPIAHYVDYSLVFN